MSSKSREASDFVRIYVIGSFEKARRKALDAIPEFKMKYPERRRAALRKGPQGLAEIFSGVVGNEPDPLAGLLARASGDLASDTRATGRALSPETTRRAIVEYASYDPKQTPTDVILFATIRIYELVDEMEIAVGRANAVVRPELRRSSGAENTRLRDAADLLREKHPSWSVNRIAEHLGSEKGQSLTAGAIRQRLRRMGIR